MPKTFGLTHIALAVADLEQAFRFYEHVLGVIAVYRGDDFIQAQTPGAHDAIVFERKSGHAGKGGGIAHFGFRLQDPAEIENAIACIQEAGGTILSQGEFCPGEPYVYFRDPDGYEVEIWYEPPTALELPSGAFA
jgi:catechol 2,3-dioxygenase-like lactoylglutathione lyase family enzyme